MITEMLEDFEVENEDFHVFELVDGSIVKAKTVLINIMRKTESGKPDQFGFQSINAVGIWAPRSNRGEVGEVYSLEVLESNIIEENIMSKQVHDGGKNVYSLENGQVFMDFRVKQIDKTSLFDSTGNPAYIVRSSSEIVVAFNEEGDDE